MKWPEIEEGYWSLQRERTHLKRYDSNSTTFWKRQKYGDKRKRNSCQELEKEMNRGSTRPLEGWRVVLINFTTLQYTQQIILHLSDTTTMKYSWKTLI